MSVYRRAVVISSNGHFLIVSRILATGRVLDYMGRSNDNRKLCSLYLSPKTRMGVKAARLGIMRSRALGSDRIPPFNTGGRANYQRKKRYG